MAKKNIKAVKTKVSVSKKNTAKKVVKNAAPVKKKVAPKRIVKKAAPVKKKVAPKRIVKKAATVKKKAISKSLKKIVSKKIIKKIATKRTNKRIKKTSPKKAIVKPVIKKLLLKVNTKKEVAPKKVVKQPILQTTTVKKALEKETPKSIPPTTNKVKPGSPKRGRKKKNKDDEEDGFDTDPAIELEIEMLRAKKRKKNDGPKIIRTPLVIHLGLEDKEIDYAKLVKNTSAPKGKLRKFELEFTINASIKFLFPFFLTPSELADWFADDVDIKGDQYTFFWDGSKQVAKLVAKKENHFVRFKWIDEPDNTYFEFRLEVDEITKDVALIISDFAEDQESREASTLLWNNQVQKLMHVIGA